MTRKQRAYPFPPLSTPLQTNAFLGSLRQRHRRPGWPCRLYPGIQWEGAGGGGGTCNNSAFLRGGARAPPSRAHTARPCSVFCGDRPVVCLAPTCLAAVHSYAVPEAPPLDDACSSVLQGLAPNVHSRMSRAHSEYEGRVGLRPRPGPAGPIVVGDGLWV